MRIAQWKQRVRSLRNEAATLYFACRHPLTPWYAKLLAFCLVAYLFCPLDLIPDPIPILGQLDDLLVIPLGMLLIRALIPKAVLAECRELAKSPVQGPFARWLVAGMILALWVLSVWLVTRAFVST